MLLILADLAGLGWRFKVVKGFIYMKPVSSMRSSSKAAKEALRRPLTDARDAQLREDSNRRFLEEMHKPRRHAGRTVSVENLVDDGKSLAKALRANRDGDLTEVVSPYLVLVDSAARCEHTGLKLIDVWRYFRHTWALIYRPTPGRTMNFLIRNAARPDHPVMGIIGLANAVFQMSQRDQWIGWTPEQLVTRAKADPAYWSIFRQQAITSLRRARDAIRSDDLMTEIGDIADPLQIVRRLETLAFEQAELRKDNLRADFDADPDAGALNARSIPRDSGGNYDWKAASDEPLFKRKRAEVLSDIWFALYVLSANEIDGEAFSNSVDALIGPKGTKLRWADADLERACKVALREIKKNGVSTRILDVNICGAAPTYREILGGKLAAYALFSEEVQEAYSKRYGDAVSEIASAMAGRAFSRPSRISILTTTSLYAVGSSQYNRVKMPIGNDALEWEKIGETEGFGTVHMSTQTVEAVRSFAVAKQGMRNVNNRFGEGTSPLMRQLREGLNMLGFDSDDVLQHSNQRIIYAVELYPNARADLSLDTDTARKNPSMVSISKHWIDRWLAMRVMNDEILNRTGAYSAASVRGDLLQGSSPQDGALPLLGAQ